MLSHYFFEILSWIGWTVIVGDLYLANLVFTFAGSLVMILKAVVQQKRYLGEFREEYPKERKIIIPFIF